MAVERTKSIRNASSRPQYKTSSGELVPGVTTVTGLRMKDALVQWAFNVGRDNPHLFSIRDYTDDLADIGKCAHAILSAHLKGEEPDLGDFTPNVVKAAQFPVNKYMEWEKGKKIDLIFSEREFVSDKHRYGGTLDVLARIDGKITVLDFKTGKAIYDEMFYQVAAYAELVVERTDMRVDEIRILQIGRVGAEGFTERVMTDWSLEFDWFLAARGLYEVEAQMRARVRRDKEIASGKVVDLAALRKRGVLKVATPAT